jgi:hypothetical protein
MTEFAPHWEWKLTEVSWVPDQEFERGRLPYESTESTEHSSKGPAMSLGQSNRTV